MKKKTLIIPAIILIIIVSVSVAKRQSSYPRRFKAPLNRMTSNDWQSTTKITFDDGHTDWHIQYRDSEKNRHSFIISDDLYNKNHKKKGLFSTALVSHKESFGACILSHMGTRLSEDITTNGVSKYFQAKQNNTSSNELEIAVDTIFTLEPDTEFLEILADGHYSLYSFDAKAFLSDRRIKPYVLIQVSSHMSEAQHKAVDTRVNQLLETLLKKYGETSNFEIISKQYDMTSTADMEKSIITTHHYVYEGKVLTMQDIMSTPGYTNEFTLKDYIRHQMSEK